MPLVFLGRSAPLGFRRRLKIPLLGRFPVSAPCGAAGPLFGRKKTTQPEGLCGEKNKTGKIHTDFPHYFITTGPFLSSVRPAKGVPKLRVVVKGSLRKRSRCLSEFPLFRPLFQKKFLLHAFRELPTAKGGGGPDKARPSKKPIFLRPAHDKLHFARRLLFPFGRLPSAEKTDVCREVCQKRSFAGGICRLPGLPGAPLGGR